MVRNTHLSVQVERTLRHVDGKLLVAAIQSFKCQQQADYEGATLLVDARQHVECSAECVAASSHLTPRR